NRRRGKPFRKEVFSQPSLEQHWLAGQRAFKSKEYLLGLQPAGAAIAPHPPLAEHAVARDDDRDRVAAAGPADGTRRRTGGRRDVAVGQCLTVGDVLHRRPGPCLEIAAVRPQRQVKILELSGEIGVELVSRLGEQWTAVASLLVAPAHGDQRAVFFFEDQI